MATLCLRSLLVYRQLTRYSALFVLPLLLASACTSLDPITAEQYMRDYVKPQHVVEVHSIAPLKLSRGTLVEIIGKNFSTNRALNRVIFPPNEHAPILEASETRLLVVVPPKAVSGNITVQSGLLSTTSTMKCTVDSAPAAPLSIAGITPNLLRPHSTATITGSGFSSTNIVYLGSQRAMILSASSDKLTIAVPDSLQPDYVVVRSALHTAISDEKYRVYDASLMPRFCRFTLKGLSMKYTDVEECDGTCPGTTTENGSSQPQLSLMYSRQSDSVWTALGERELLLDLNTNRVRIEHFIIDGGSSSLLDCSIHSSVRDIPVTALPEAGHYIAQLSGKQIEEVLGFWIAEAHCYFSGSGHCHCSCNRHIDKFEVLPEALLTIEFWR